jgi:hypothetical protein
MGKALHSLLAFLLILTGQLCYSQTGVRVSDPRLEMVGNTIHISYDILNSAPDGKYTISIVIKDEDGNIIKARALDGEIGEGISGGSNKKITWNLEADNILIDAFIFVQINAKVIAPPTPAIIEPEEETVQDDQTDTQPEEPPQVTKSSAYNRTGIILQSLALPGLGLTQVTGKPHWIRGVAGYGCIAASVVLNSQAVKTYDGIEDLVYFDEINEAYDKSLQQDNISEILSYAAIGIWVADFIWTLVGTSDLKKKPYTAESSGISLGSNIDPLSNIPLISVTYRF